MQVGESELTRPIQDRWALLLTLLLALGVRLLGMVSRPIWYDEAFSVLFSDKGPAAILAGTLSASGNGAAEEHPLAYYGTLWAWMRIFGDSPAAVRSLSVLAGLACIVLIYLLARAAFGSHIAFAGALIAALAPYQVHYSQEIRMYILLALWLLLATYYYWRASQTLNWSWWLGFALCAALAQYTHNLAAFYLLALAFWPLLMRQWRIVLRVAFAGMLALVLYSPWLVHIPSQLAKVDQTYWIERPGLYRLLTLLILYVANLPLQGWQLGLGLGVSLFVVTLAILQTARAMRRGQPDARVGAWLMYLSFAPPLLLFLVSQWVPLYVERALLPSGATFCIWLAWAFFNTGLPRPVALIGVLVLALAFGVGLWNNVTYLGFPYAPYPRLMSSLQARLQPGDVVIHSNKLSMLPSVYYARDLAQSYVADPPGSAQDTLAAGTQSVLGLEAQPDLQTAVDGASRIWFVIFSRSNAEYVQAGFKAHPQLLWLEANYTLISVSNWDDLRLYLFSRRH